MVELSLFDRLQFLYMISGVGGRRTTLVVERRRRCADPGLTSPVPALSCAGLEQGKPPGLTALHLRG